MGSTERIFVFGPRPYTNAISHIRMIDYCNPNNFLTPGKTPEFDSLLYCGFCNQHTTYHEHTCNNDPPWDLNDSYLSDAHDTDSWMATSSWLSPTGDISDEWLKDYSLVWLACTKAKIL